MLRPCPGGLNYRKSPKSTSDRSTGLLVLQLLQSPDRGFDCDGGRCAGKDKEHNLICVMHINEYSQHPVRLSSSAVKVSLSFIH